MRNLVAQMQRLPLNQWLSRCTNATKSTSKEGDWMEQPQDDLTVTGVPNGAPDFRLLGGALVDLAMALDGKGHQDGQGQADDDVEAA
ncbi:MAG: hypothetical protein AAF567_06890 [Actinomycetota bacterium]